MAIPMGTTHSSKVLYVEEREREDGELEFPGARAAELEVRDWDVTDPDVRDAVAEEQGVADDDYYRLHAQWFINPTLNAAVLIVYRPKVQREAAPSQ